MQAIISVSETMCASWFFFPSVARVLGPDFQTSICVYKMGNCTHKWTILYAIIHFAYRIISFWGYNTCTWDLVSLHITPSFENLVPIVGLLYRKEKWYSLKKKSVTLFFHGSSLSFNDLYTYSVINRRIPTTLLCMTAKQNYCFYCKTEEIKLYQLDCIEYLHSITDSTCEL